MYDYDYMLNGEITRDAYEEKIREAEEWRRANKFSRKNTGIRKFLAHVFNH